MQKELRGAATAKALQDAIKSDVAALLQQGITPLLAILRAGDSDDDKAYESNLTRRCEKAGVAVRCVNLPDNCDTGDCIDAVKALNDDACVHGVLIMRPMPAHLDERAITATLHVHKDIDGMTPLSLARVFMGEAGGFAPCTAQAVVELLTHEGIELLGKEAVIIGRSLVAGKPLAMLLLHEHATVTICHTRTKKLPQVCRRADILIAAAGQRHLVDAKFIKPGAILVDVGIHAGEDGKIDGDIHPDAYQKAKAYTPVPGGVGTVTSCLLIEHAVRAAKRAGGLL